MTITSTEYQKVREGIGSQRDVSKLLGVDIRTVQRREAGEILITFEATRALFCLSAIDYLHGLTTEDNGVKQEDIDKVLALLEAH